MRSKRLIRDHGGGRYVRQNSGEGDGLARRILTVSLIIFVWTARAQADPLYTVTDLGAFTSLGSPPSGYVPQLGTNAQGQGYVLSTNGQQAYLFQRTSTDYPLGTGLSPSLSSALEPLYYGANEPHVINQYTVNSQGWIVGQAGSNSEYGGFSFLFKSGDPNPISGGQWTINDINSSNVIVGSFYKIYTLLPDGSRYYGVIDGQAYQFEYHAALFSMGGSSNSMTDLNTLISAGSGWNLTNALKIDDLGQIVGVGTLDGPPHAFLLTPGGDPTLVNAPEPSPLALIGLVAAMLGLRRAFCRRCS